MWSSEPLPAELVATIDDGTGFAVTLEPCRSSPPAMPSSLCAPAGTVWPLGSELSVRFSPELRDLAGNVRLPPLLVLRSIPDPGILAEDGFEGDVHAWFFGDAAVVPGLGMLPALSGSRSVLILPPFPEPRGGRMFARIALDPGDTAITFRYRMVYTGDYDHPFWGSVRAGPAGAGPTVELDLPDRPPGALVPTGDALWTMASSPADATIVLPPGVSGEAWLDIDITSGACGRIPSLSEAGILIDDVRTE